MCFTSSGIFELRSNYLNYKINIILVKLQITFSKFAKNSI